MSEPPFVLHCYTEHSSPDIGDPWCNTHQRRFSACQSHARERGGCALDLGVKYFDRPTEVPISAVLTQRRVIRPDALVLGGSIVQLRSGGEHMVVGRDHVEGEIIWCQWHDKQGAPHNDQYHRAVLWLISEPAIEGSKE